jgi:hypothetical protein
MTDERNVKHGNTYKLGERHYIIGMTTEVHMTRSWIEIQLDRNVFILLIMFPFISNATSEHG